MAYFPYNLIKHGKASTEQTHKNLAENAKTVSKIWSEFNCNYVRPHAPISWERISSPISYKRKTKKSTNKLNSSREHINLAIDISTLERDRVKVQTTPGNWQLIFKLWE